MKKILASFGWMLLLLPLISVAGARTAYAIKSDDAIVSETRNVSGFTGISSGGAFKVYVTLGEKESFRIEAKEETLKLITTVVEDGILKIKYTKDNYLNSMRKKNFNPGPVNIYITAISLNNLNVSGSGDMKIEGTVKADKLTTSVSGSGDLYLNVSANSYFASISGSGQTNVSGSARVVDVKVSGSGDFKGKDLKTESSEVKVSGSGSIALIANNSLAAAISGSGHVRYSGDAKVTTSKSGSGKVSKI
jgi:hypothetical protein